MGKTEIEEEGQRIGETIKTETLDGLNADQLWAIYIALEKSVRTLIRPLGQGSQKLAKQIYKYGKQKYHWT